MSKSFSKIKHNILKQVYQPESENNGNVGWLDELLEQWLLLIKVDISVWNCPISLSSWLDRLSWETWMANLKTKSLSVSSSTFTQQSETVAILKGEDLGSTGSILISTFITLVA